jgi:hypothetical protein
MLRSLNDVARRANPTLSAGQMLEPEDAPATYLERSALAA